MARKLLIMLALAVAGPCLVAAINVVALLSPHQVDLRVRAALDWALAAPYTLGHVELTTSGFRLESLTIRDPESGEAIVHIDEAILPLDWSRLDAGTLVVRKPRVRVVRTEAGMLNLARLIRSDLFERDRDQVADLPHLHVVVEGARLSIEDPALFQRGQVVTLHDVDLDLATGGDQIAASLTIRESWAESIEARVEIELASQAVRIEIDADKVWVRPDTRALLPRKGQRVYDLLHAFGVADAIVRIESRPDAPLDMDIRVRLHRGGLSFAKFPYRVEDTSGWLRITRDRVALEGLVVEHKGARIACDGTIDLRPLGEPNVLDLRLDVRDFPLDEQFRAALPPNVRALVARFRPRGRASAKVHIYGSSNPPGIEDDLYLDILAEPQGITARFEGLPLPVSALEGKVRVEVDFGAPRPGRPNGNAEELLSIDLRGSVAGGRIYVDGQAGEDAVQMRIRVEDAVVDADVLRALDLPIDRLASLEPRGRLNAEIEVFGRSEKGESLDVDYVVQLTPKPGFQLTVEGLDGPVAIERGRIRVVQDAVSTDDLVLLTRGVSTIDVRGSLEPQSGELDVALVARDVVVDDRLRETLHGGGDVAQQIGEVLDTLGVGRAPIQAGGSEWFGSPIVVRLGANGQIDELAVQVRGRVESAEATGDKGAREGGGAAQTRDASAEGLSARVQARFSGFTLRPEAFPLFVEDFGGRLDYDGRAITLTDLRGRIGHGRVVVDGVIALPTGDGPAESSSLRVRANRVELGVGVLRALPEQVRGAFARIAPTGEVNLDGTVLYVPTSGTRAAGVVWNVTFDAYVDRLDAGLQFDEVALSGHLFGSLPLEGPLPDPICSGTVEVARALWLGEPLSLRGRVKVGRDAFSFTDVVGTLFDGALTGDGVFFRYNGTRFGGIFDLRGGQVAAVRSVNSGRAKRDQMLGTMNIHLAFDGVPAGKPSEQMRGTGTIEITSGRLWMGVSDGRADVKLESFSLDDDSDHVGIRILLGSRAKPFRGKGPLVTAYGVGRLFPRLKHGRPVYYAEARVVPNLIPGAEDLPLIGLPFEAVNWFLRKTVGAVTALRVYGELNDVKFGPAPPEDPFGFSDIVKPKD